MWIIPKNHQLYSAFAQECLASKEELIEHFNDLVGSEEMPSLTWRSKPSLLKTWCARWSRVFWIQRLFSRTLKPFVQSRFEEKLRASLADIHVSHFLLPENLLEKKIQDTSGHTSESASGQLDLFGASLKTLPIILTSDMKLSGVNYKDWVIMLRKEYTQRQRLARLTSESECLSSRSWLTPIANDSEKRGQAQSGLIYQVNNWATPRVGGQEKYQTRLIRGKDMGLQGQVQYLQEQQNLLSEKTFWPTPTTAEAGKIPNRANYGSIGLSNHPEMVGLPNREKVLKAQKGINGHRDLEKISMNGNTLVLNPRWVLQLMGTTFEKTFFVWPETGS
jgi:hypothetical protein